MTESDAHAVRPSRLREIRRFAVVGAIAFAIDVGLLALLLRTTDLGAVAARLPALAAALICAWLMHRNWTFRETRRRRSRPREFFAYLSAQSVGMAINYGVFTALVALQVPFAGRPILAVAAASAVATVVNYLLARRVVFDVGHERRPRGAGR